MSFVTMIGFKEFPITSYHLSSFHVKKPLPEARIRTTVGIACRLFFETNGLRSPKMEKKGRS